MPDTNLQTNAASFVQFTLTLFFIAFVVLLLAIIWLDPIKKSAQRLEQRQPCTEEKR